MPPPVTVLVTGVVGVGVRLVVVGLLPASGEKVGVGVGAKPGRVILEVLPMKKARPATRMRMTRMSAGTKYFMYEYDYTISGEVALVWWEAVLAVYFFLEDGISIAFCIISL